MVLKSNYDVFIEISENKKPVDVKLDENINLDEKILKHF